MSIPTDHGLDNRFTDPAGQRRRMRGSDPLSNAARRRLLAKLQAAADAGDVAASKALIELGLAARRDRRIADVLERLGAAQDAE